MERRPANAPEAAPELSDTQRFEPTQALPGRLDEGEQASMPPLPRSSALGHIGRYTLQQAIGEGGLGVVYAAHDPVLSRRIAIKTLNLVIPSEERESLTRMLLQEARAAAGLSHPNIVTVHDAGLSGEGVYIAMELLKGQDLRHLLAQGWRPTAGQAALIVRRVADALAYAHSRGVVHRDIKPANLFMVGRTQPRVLDFGIAHVAEQRDSRDVVAGSPFYMSPEQIRRQPTDRRTDVFSLGVVLYELLTGERPFQGATLAAITEAVCSHQPPPAHLLRKEVPPELSDIAARAMDKDPAQRYSSARAFARQLRHWLDAHPEALGLAEERPPAPRWRRPSVLAGLGVAAAGLASVVVTLAWWVMQPPADVPEVTGKLTGALSVVPGPTPRPAEHEPAPGPSRTQARPAVPEAIASARPRSAPPVRQVARAAEAAPPAAARSPRPGSSAPAADRRASASQASRPTRSQTVVAASAPRTKATRPAVVAPTAAPAPVGEMRLAVTPWARVEVDGRPVGLTPPLNVLSLPAGRHEVSLHNDGGGSRRFTLEVEAGRAVVLRHRFSP